LLSAFHHKSLRRIVPTHCHRNHIRQVDETRYLNTFTDTRVIRIHLHIHHLPKASGSSIAQRTPH